MNDEKNNLGVNNQLPPMGSAVNEISQNNFSNFNNNTVQPASDNNVSVFDLMEQFSGANVNGSQSSAPTNNMQQAPMMPNTVSNDIPVQQIPVNNMQQAPMMPNTVSNDIPVQQIPVNNMQQAPMMPNTVSNDMPVQQIPVNNMQQAPMMPNTVSNDIPVQQIPVNNMQQAPMMPNTVSNDMPVQQIPVNNMQQAPMMPNTVSNDMPVQQIPVNNMQQAPMMPNAVTNDMPVQQIPVNNMQQAPMMPNTVSNDIPVQQIPVNNMQQAPMMPNTVSNDMPVQQIPVNNMQQAPMMPNAVTNDMPVQQIPPTNVGIDNNQTVDLNNSNSPGMDIFSIGKGDSSNGMFVPPIIMQEEVKPEEVDKNGLINSLMNDISSSDEKEEPKSIEPENNTEKIDESKTNKKNKKLNIKMIIIIGAAVLLLLAIALILYFLVFNKSIETKKIICSMDGFDDVNNYETNESITLNFKGNNLSSAEIDHNITFHETPEEQKAALLANFKNEYEGRGKDFSSIEYDTGVEFIVTYEPSDFKSSFGMEDSDMKKDNIILTLKNSGYTCE